MRVIPCRPHRTDTSRLLLAHHREDACYARATDHPTDHMLQATPFSTEQGCQVPAREAGEALSCPSSAILAPRSHSNPLHHMASPASVSSGCMSCRWLPGHPPAVVKQEEEGDACDPTIKAVVVYHSGALSANASRHRISGCRLPPSVYLSQHIAPLIG